MRIPILQHLLHDLDTSDTQLKLEHQKSESIIETNQLNKHASPPTIF